MKLYFPFSFGKTYNLDYLSSSVRFLLKSFFYSVFKELRSGSLSESVRISLSLVSEGSASGNPRSFDSLFPLVGLDGLEPSTSRLSGARSSHLSYKPRFQLIGSDSSICLPFPFQGFGKPLRGLVEMKGIEPLTPCLQGRCSPS